MNDKKRRQRTRRAAPATSAPAAAAIAPARRRWLPWAIGLALLLVAALLYTLWPRLARDQPVAAPVAAAAPAFVGADTCKQCHAPQFSLWQGSDHERAMQHASAASVAGDFADARFVYNGITSTFFRRDDKFFVNTDGPDGQLHDYEIRYTFGVYPLQQYLIEFPDGRVQALSIAWDTRPREQGGQRWYHLYPDQHIDHKDALHWTGLNQNWNYMCAECHSTNLKKGYDPAADTFHTTWSEINVACESCHGPGSAHVAWAGGDRAGAGADKGLVVNFPARAAWQLNPATGNAERATPRTEHRELETCGLCHSRRAQLREGYTPGQALLDNHLISLLDEGLYSADGQMSDEVFNYGSFLQSRMYAAGVSCGDCHDPHSLKLRSPGDGTCAQCHAVTRYATPEHHHHAPEADAARCVSCHMPVRTYMGVDRRHDHSFRVPRPDESVQLGTPNACNDCHADKTPAWAAAAVENWFGPERKGLQHFAPALHAARAQLPAAGALLRAIAAHSGQPGIARATAYAELAPYLTPALLAEMRAGLAAADPLVRLGALRGLAGVPPEQRWALAAPLLEDPRLALRSEAAAFLAGTPVQTLTPAQRTLLDRAIDENIAVQRTNADRPEAHLNLGLLYAQRGDAAAAEQAYRRALALDPAFVQGYINLADLYRDLGRDGDGEQLLRAGLPQVADPAALRHVLGLLLVRGRQLDAALVELKAAAQANPDAARYAYVYGVALDAAGRKREALQVLSAAQRRHPADRDLLVALINFQRAAGGRAEALKYARQLAALLPDDVQVAQLLRTLEQTP